MRSSRIESRFEWWRGWLDHYLLAAVVLCFLMGDTLICVTGFLPCLLLPVLLAALVLLVVALFLRRFRLLLAVAFLLGVFWSGVYLAELASFPYADGRAVEISGQVTEVVPAKENYLTEITAVEKSEEHTTFLLKGTTSDGWRGTVMAGISGCEIKQGDELRLVGNVREQNHLQNPYLSSGEYYLRNLGAAAYLQVIPGELRITSLQKAHPIRAWVEQWKEHLYLQMEQLPEKQQHLLKGLAFGDKTLFSSYDTNVLSQTGVAHVFAVSGMHMVFVIGFVLGALRLLGRKIRLPKWLQFGLVALFTLLYAMMCGFTFSVTRAVMMGLAAAAALIYQEHYSSRLTLLYAAFLCVLAQPFAVCDVGFQLSFLATFALLYTYSLWRRLVRFAPLATVLAAQMLTLPIVVYQFNVLTVVGLLLSPLVSFISGFVVVLAFLAMLFAPLQLSSFFLMIGGVISRFIYDLCVWASTWPGSWLAVIKPSVVLVLLSYLLMFVAYGLLWRSGQSVSLSEREGDKTKIGTEARHDQRA